MCVDIDHFQRSLSKNYFVTIYPLIDSFSLVTRNRSWGEEFFKGLFFCGQSKFFQIKCIVQFYSNFLEFCHAIRVNLGGKY